ncbi:hypothetical protein [Flaviflexus massiliensis]|uniref:hypothetical protein n=1 Tax=Flaviflexus massiliensis TaxID=1522309 RepID=UPI0012B61D7C|nr:hypothetical protein [Flaviflexus massiliensis]
MVMIELNKDVDETAVQEVAESSAKKKLKAKQKRKKRLSKLVDQSGRGSFPASDPPGRY